MGLFNFFRKKDTEPKNNSQSETPPSISFLEKGGLSYYKHQKYYSGIFTFHELVKQEPENINAWYGLGACLYIVGRSAGIKDLVIGGGGCFKYALNKSGGEHRFSNEFLKKVEADKFLSPEELVNLKPTTQDLINKVVLGLGLNNNLLLEEFKALNVNERMTQVIFIGESAAKFFWPVMKYAILEDTDRDVKFASLKRIHLYKNETNLDELFKSASEQNTNEELEPYFSMALHKINEPWTNNYKGKAYHKLFGNNHNLN